MEKQEICREFSLEFLFESGHLEDKSIGRNKIEKLYTGLYWLKGGSCGGSFSYWRRIIPLSICHHLSVPRKSWKIFLVKEYS
jgi:hypothetical protein